MRTDNQFNINRTEGKLIKSVVRGNVMRVNIVSLEYGVKRFCCRRIYKLVARFNLQEKYKNKCLDI